ncbi:hypothetical protein KIL84_020246 [Mauremys mutica]|uniref:Uncharacterized protein n=1 Tax=Mauremys mutica TaxID=74926 RepID=A0A9D4B427_9SAUR|nr:hypothetical protein KIL84_020246 [Mauremys mutica]
MRGDTFFAHGCKPLSSYYFIQKLLPSIMEVLLPVSRLPPSASSNNSQFPVFLFSPPLKSLRLHSSDSYLDLLAAYAQPERLLLVSVSYWKVFHNRHDSNLEGLGSVFGPQYMLA